MKFAASLFIAMLSLVASDICTDCWPPSSGPCQQSNGVCHSYVFGECPPNTMECTSIPPPPPPPTCTEEGKFPTKIEINIWLAVQPIHNDWTRFLVFYYYYSILGPSEKKVAVDFMKEDPGPLPTEATYLKWHGEVTDPADLEDLCSMVIPGRRRYWDTMFFENRGGITELKIKDIEVWIEYGNKVRELKRMKIAHETFAPYKVLASGDDRESFRLTNWRGRGEQAREYLGWSVQAWQYLPLELREFFNDLGKSGSDGAPQDNPKYGLADTNMCTETVSWYLHEYGEPIWIDPDFFFITFEDADNHYDMFNWYLLANRLYCYNHYAEEWRLREAVPGNPRYRTNVAHIQNYAKEKPDGDFYTYTPRAGDYLNCLTRIDEDGNEYDGHSMMVASWNGGSGGDGYMLVIEGPFPVSFRNVTVHRDEERHERDYCVGRNPKNDDP